jgi:dTDP-4-dehydrorhamnose reductase
MKKILVTGINGFLGGAVPFIYKDRYHITGIYNNSKPLSHEYQTYKLDLSHQNEVLEFFEINSFDAVLHLAALSNPNTCEGNPALSYSHNVQATKNLVDVCGIKKIKLIFTSTDLVYDGEYPYYDEESSTKPLNIYGNHKLEAESIVLKASELNVVARLPLLYGIQYANGISCLSTIVSALESGANINLFTNEYRTMTSNYDILEALSLLIDKGKGLYCLGGDESISRYDFGILTAKVMNKNSDNIIPCLQKDVNMIAKRARDVSMKNNKMKELGWKVSSIRDSLEKMLLK